MLNQSSLCNDRFSFLQHNYILTPLVNWLLLQFKGSCDQLTTSKVPIRSNHSGSHCSLAVSSMIKIYYLAQATLGTHWPTSLLNLWAKKRASITYLSKDTRAALSHCSFQSSGERGSLLKLSENIVKKIIHVKFTVTFPQNITRSRFQAEEKKKE